MLSVSIDRYSESSVVATIDVPSSFEKAFLHCIIGDEDIIVDRYDNQIESSERGSLSINSNKVTIHSNKLEFDSVLDGEFYIEFIDSNNVVIDNTEVIKIDIVAPKHIIGAAKKVIHDFNTVARINGIELYYFIVDDSAGRCPDCWDEQLGQIIDSTCKTCGGSGYVSGVRPIKFTARRIKTSGSSIVENIGKVSQDTIAYQTVSRLPFSLNDVLFDSAYGTLMEVKDANSAFIGSIQTTTTIVGKKIPSDDKRYKSYLKTLA